MMLGVVMKRETENYFCYSVPVEVAGTIDNLFEEVTEITISCSTDLHGFVCVPVRV